MPGANSAIETSEIDTTKAQVHSSGQSPEKTVVPSMEQVKPLGRLKKLLSFFRTGAKTEPQLNTAENQRKIEEIRRGHLSQLSMARNASPSFKSGDDPRLELKYLEEIKQLGGVNALTPEEFDRRAKLIALKEADATHQQMSEAFEAEVRAKLIKDEGYGQTIAESEVSATGATASAPEKGIDTQPKPLTPVVGGGLIGEKTPA